MPQRDLHSAVGFVLFRPLRCFACCAYVACSDYYRDAYYRDPYGGGYGGYGGYDSRGSYDRG